jgi:hypothetical protein
MSNPPQFTRPASALTVWGSALSSPDITAQADVSLGFTKTGLPPNRGFFNQALNKPDAAARYLLQRGVSAWAADEKYFPGCIVVLGALGGDVSYVYRVVSGGSPTVGVAPTVDCSPSFAGLIVPGANWERIAYSASQQTGHPIFGNGYDGDWSPSVSGSIAPATEYDNVTLDAVAHTGLTISAWAPLIVSGTLTLNGAPTIANDAAAYYDTDVLSGAGSYLRGGTAGGTANGATTSYIDPVMFPFAQTAVDIAVPGGDGGLGGGLGSPGGYTIQAKWAGSAYWQGRVSGFCVAPGHWAGPLYDAAGHYYAHRLHPLAGGMGGTAGVYGTSSTNGGVGGGGGKVVCIYARNLVITNGTPVITARGEDGHDPADNSHGAGVGGGGGGGQVVIVYQNSNLTYAALSAMFTAAICCPGGAIGANGVTTGATAGSTGKLALIQVARPQ